MHKKCALLITCGKFAIINLLYNGNGSTGEVGLLRDKKEAREGWRDQLAKAVEDGQQPDGNRSKLFRFGVDEKPAERVRDLNRVI